MIKKGETNTYSTDVAATIFAGSASAFDPYDLQKLKDTGDCISCDLEGANLRDADPEGSILYNITMPDGSINDSVC